ncbi:MAG: hypothetical protein IJL91_04745 [Bacteroidales bacterium]|nr:hypothetical protein [Bacteroidales bacterium]
MVPINAFSTGARNVSGLAISGFGSLLRVGKSSLFDGLFNSDDFDWRKSSRKRYLPVHPK